CRAYYVQTVAALRGRIRYLDIIFPLAVKRRPGAVTSPGARGDVRRMAAFADPWRKAFLIRKLHYLIRRLQNDFRRFYAMPRWVIFFLPVDDLLSSPCPFLLESFDFPFEKQFHDFHVGLVVLPLKSVTSGFAVLD